MSKGRCHHLLREKLLRDHREEKNRIKEEKEEALLKVIPMKEEIEEHKKRTSWKGKTVSGIQQGLWVTAQLIRKWNYRLRWKTSLILIFLASTLPKAFSDLTIFDDALFCYMNLGSSLFSGFEHNQITILFISSCFFSYFLVSQIFCIFRFGHLFAARLCIRFSHLHAYNKHILHLRIINNDVDFSLYFCNCSAIISTTVTIFIKMNFHYLCSFSYIMILLMYLKK